MPSCYWRTSTKQSHQFSLNIHLSAPVKYRKSSLQKYLYVVKLMFTHTKISRRRQMNAFYKRIQVNFYWVFSHIQWNLCNPIPEFSDILWHPAKNYGPKVFLLTKIKPEYSNILYNPTHFSGPWCVIRQVPLYIFIFS